MAFSTERAEILSSATAFSYGPARSSQGGLSLYSTGENVQFLYGDATQPLPESLGIDSAANSPGNPATGMKTGLPGRNEYGNGMGGQFAGAYDEAYKATPSIKGEADFGKVAQAASLASRQLSPILTSGNPAGREAARPGTPGFVEMAGEGHGKVLPSFTLVSKGAGPRTGETIVLPEIETLPGNSGVNVRFSPGENETTETVNSAFFSSGFEPPSLSALPGSLAVGLLPLDVADLDRAVETFFARMKNLGDTFTDSSIASQIAPWLVASLTVAMGLEVARRRLAPQVTFVHLRGTREPASGWLEFPQLAVHPPEE